MSNPAPSSDHAEGVFRDPSPGMQERRSVLLRRRRDDLAALPHVVRRIYVARAGRLAAGIVGALGGATLVVAALADGGPAALGRLVPGRSPAALATLLLGTWLVAALAYLAARAAAEHRFAVAMSRCVLPGADLAHDVERLAHERPAALARAMVRRLEIGATLVPVIAAAALIPATIIYLGLAMLAAAWPSPGLVEDTLIAHSASLVVGLLGGLGAALALGSSRLRGPRARSGFGAVAVIGLGSALVIAAGEDFDLAALVATPATIAAAAYWSSRRLGREAITLDVEDTMAGAEVFELRRVVAAIGRGVVAVRQAVTVANLRRGLGSLRALGRRRGRVAIGAAAVAAIAAAAVGVLAARSGGAAAAAPSARPGRIVSVTSASPGTAPGRITAIERYDGALTVEASFTYAASVSDTDVGLLAELPVVPRGWRARTKLTLLSIDGDLTDSTPPVFVSPAPGVVDVAPRQLTAGAPVVEIDVVSCDDQARPLGLEVAPYGGRWTPIRHTVRLRYEVTLMPDACTVIE